MDFNGLKERVILAVNRLSGVEYDYWDPSDAFYSQVKKLFIEKDENSFRCSSGHMDIDINHAFGVGVKKIADELLLQTRKEE
jgi:hypothetical protein